MIAKIGETCGLALTRAKIAPLVNPKHPAVECWAFHRLGYPPVKAANIHVQINLRKPAFVIQEWGRAYTVDR
jgi:hypothetical protein